MVENELLKNYDAWVKDTGPSALVIGEYLMPVEGHDGIHGYGVCGGLRLINAAKQLLNSISGVKVTLMKPNFSWFPAII
jgi:hypothetical protein